VAGFLQFAHVWYPLTTWLAPVAAPLGEASNGKEAIASVASVLLGLAGIAVAYLLYGTRSRPAPKTLGLLEHKFYFDELYATLFYAPANALAPALARFVERPLIAGSIGEIARGFRLGSGEVGRLQNGLVRSYALAIASGVAVLAVVFLSTR
jgi:NADH-quinone oxidoreductase subunit L